MLKLIKYEMKAQARKIAIVLLTLSLVNLLAFAVYQWSGGSSSSVGAQLGTGESSLSFFVKGAGLSVVLSYLLNMSTIVLSFIWGIELLRRDLYSDTGMLLLSLPRRGWQIIGAKLAAATLQFLVLTLPAAAFSLLQTVGISRMDLGFWFKRATDITPQALGLLLLFLILFLYFFLSVMNASYLAVTCSRSFLRMKRLRWILTFGLFVGVVALVMKAEIYLERLLPYSLDLSRPFIESGSWISEIATVNFAATLFEIAIMTAIAALSGYLLEKKVEV